MLMLFYLVTNLSPALVLISFQFVHDKQKQTKLLCKSQEEHHKTFPEGTGALLVNGTDGARAGCCPTGNAGFLPDCRSSVFSLSLQIKSKARLFVPRTARTN